MILDKLNKELSEFDVKIEFNKTNPLYSDFTLSHKGKIIGNGWKWENKQEVVGFMGWALPSLNGKLCWTKNRSSLSHEEYEDVIDLFQFAISQDYYWFSPPTNRQMAGFSCKSLTDSSKFIEYINQFIKNNYDPEIFLSERFKWVWPEIQ